jgi:lipoyl(octanoyl) transferase
VIRTCARFGVAADREPGKTGVWTGADRDRKKLCSMGIACRKWVTFHGLALNVTTDLAYFQRINPCGFESNVMSSLAARLGNDVDMAAARAALVDELGDVLGRVAITESAAASVA